MPSNKNAVESAADLIREHLKELDAERVKLENALKSLGESVTSGARRTPATAPTKRRSAGKLPQVSQRRRKGGTRAEQAVQLIADNPGIGAGDIATKLKLKPNYMYRVLSDLQQAGHVVKNGRSYSVPEK